MITKTKQLLLITFLSSSLSWAMEAGDNDGEKDLRPAIPHLMKAEKKEEANKRSYEATFEKGQTFNNQSSLPLKKKRKVEDSDKELIGINPVPILPDEVMIHILSYLPGEDLVAVSLVSKEFYQLTLEEGLWRELVEEEDQVDKPEGWNWKKFYKVNNMEDLYYSMKDQSENNNHEEALKQCIELANRDYIPGILRLAKVYEKGLWGQERDHDKAFNLVKKATKVPDHSVHSTHYNDALFKLGCYYCAGIGVDVDSGEAAAIFTELNDLGDKRGREGLKDMKADGMLSSDDEEDSSSESESDRDDEMETDASD